MSNVEYLLLLIQLGIEISILLLSVDEEALLIINFLTESRNHVDIDLNSVFVVFLHSSFFIGDSIEVLFET